MQDDTMNEAQGQAEAADAQFGELTGAAEAFTPGALSILNDLSLPVAIELGRTRMSVQEILGLGRGSVIQLERLAGEPVDVFVGDRRFAEGEVVVVGEQFGVRVTRIVHAAQAGRRSGLTGPSFLATSAALAFVLGLLVLLGWLARRWTPRGGARGGAGHVEVMSRVALAPRQGVATLRIEGRSVLVSYGEGGVRLLTELEAAPEALEREAADEAPPRFGQALARAAARRVPALKALTLGLALALLPLAASPATAGAQAVPSAVAQTRPAEGGPAGAARVAAERQRKGGDIAGALPDVRLSVGSGDGNRLELDGPVGTVLFMGVLTLLPTLLLVMTSFTRILIVLHLLKQALGTQTAPPAHLLAAMALILTGFVMAPTLEQANATALAPWMDGEIETGEMLHRAAVPFRAFMLHSTREQDLAQYVRMSDAPPPESADDIPLVTLTAAFVTSELTSAFQMGFAIFLPFLVIDIVVASVLMSMGMFMLPPVMVSLPFKLLLFVLVDGWSLVLGSLVQSFH